MGKSFNLAVKEKAAEEAGLEYPFDFELGDRTIPFRKPTSGEAMIFTLAAGSHVRKAEKLGMVIDCFVRVVHPDDHDYIVGLLLDDRLGPDEVFGTGETPDDNGIIGYMLEEWGARPTRR